MNLLFLVLILVVATVHSVSPYTDEILEEWQAFKLKYNKLNRDNDELRFQNFLKNRKKIAEHNKLYDVGKVSFMMGFNEYSDMDEQEFIDTMTNGFYYATENQFMRNATVFHSPTKLKAPESLDWRTKDAVTEVKNQGQCGSCWAFGATGALESQHFLKTGKLVVLSEQNLVDCVTYSYGCNGGWKEQAFNYIIQNGGINTEKVYPYQAQDGKCRYDPTNIGATLYRYARTPSNNEQALLEAVYTVGPIAVDIDASYINSYKSGVFYDAKCNAFRRNHSVLVVGFGTDAQGGDYWLVKNSWGKSWGENGYLKIARNRGNHCGIAAYTSYPIVKKL